MMRVRMALAFGLLATMAVAGCAAPDTGDEVATAGGAPTPSSSAEAKPDRDAPLKFSQCMREQGLTWFPDPNPGGQMSIKIPKGADKAKVDAAMEACKQWSPDAGRPEKADPEMLEQARKLSQCMRDNGVTKFPDPDPNGNMHIDGDKVGMGPGDPAFDKADKACSGLRPSGATQGRTVG
jgi:hypothetical protein